MRNVNAAIVPDYRVRPVSLPEVREVPHEVCAGTYRYTDMRGPFGSAPSIFVIFSQRKIAIPKLIEQSYEISSDSSHSMWKRNRA